MQLIDSLSYYRMKDYDRLYKVSFKSSGGDYLHTYFGWILKQDEQSILLLNINGLEIVAYDKELTAMAPMPINDTTINFFVKKAQEDFEPRDNYYLLCLWLYKKGKLEYSKRLLSKEDMSFSSANIRDQFGFVYYDDMLSAFSKERNYSKAIVFGNHLSRNVFKGYTYQIEAIALTRQLKRNSLDFKSFRLPDSLQWHTVKLTLSRKEQIIYLANRLRLLNCIQISQPGGIGYEMPQFSISFTDAEKLGIDYWQPNVKYGVINPFLELLRMKLNLREVELLLPYMLSDDYIASYSYYRDFTPERYLHTRSYVIHSLLFEITNRYFFDQSTFESSTIDQKSVEVQRIKKWCDKNADISREDVTISTLKTTDDWFDFQKCLATSRQEKYKSLLSIVINRYHDFEKSYPEESRSLIAETVYELGNETNIGTVRRWASQTTDPDVKFWTSLFLLKYDKNNYRYAMAKLEAVLKEDDGISLYPKAIDLLLSMNDKGAFELAEGIISKTGFQWEINDVYYLNFVRKLLIRKSDYVFNLINKKIASFTPEEIAFFKKSDGNVGRLTENDSFVMAVDQLKGDKPGYNVEEGSSFKSRLAYKQALSKWFTIQYNLLKNGKPNELRLNIVHADEPAGPYLDTPHY